MVPDYVKRGWELLAAALRKMFEIIFAILLLPFRALGLVAGGGQRSAADVAAEAIEAASHEPAPEPTYALGDLIKAHAGQRMKIEAGIVDTRRLAPLPPHVEAWMGRMSRTALVTCASSPARYLQEHVLMQPGQRGHFDAQLGRAILDDTPPAYWTAGTAAAKGVTGEGRSGGGQKAKPAAVTDILAELGIVMDEPAPSGMRPR